MTDHSADFVTVDLTKLMDEGVLMAANEAFFWPLGLALTWNRDDNGFASNLHIREWEFEDGHIEPIELLPDDPVVDDRRAHYATWLANRKQRMRTD